MAKSAVLVKMYVIVLFKSMAFILQDVQLVNGSTLMSGEMWTQVYRHLLPNSIDLLQLGNGSPIQSFCFEFNKVRNTLLITMSLFFWNLEVDRYILFSLFRSRALKDHIIAECLRNFLHESSISCHQWEKRIWN